MRRLLLALLVTLPLHAAELRVYAAASLSDVLRELAPLHRRATGDRMVFNFAGSNVLARQIATGAPADLFLSADEAKMNSVARHVDRRASVLSNTLVVLGDVRTARRIALADPESVPAGMYAKTYLQKEGLWASVRKRVIPTENVRAALAAFEHGHVDATIVYATDTRRGVRVTNGPDISYPFATLKSSKNLGAARRLLAWLQTKPALDVFRRHGFGIR
jgi:molybdate transport system substrate-binding protein